MVKKCTSKDINSALAYIGDNKVLCAYMYMDIKSCGVNDTTQQMFFSEFDGKICAIYYQYFDCLHIYSEIELDCEDTKAVISNIKPKVIISQIKDMNVLKCIINIDECIIEQNHVGSFRNRLEVNDKIKVEMASIDDLDAVTKLTLSSPIYSEVYDYKTLYSSLKSRLETKFGRVFIVRNEEGSIVAAITTNAESDDLVMMGGLIVADSERGKGIAQAISAIAWNEINDEGKFPMSNVIIDNIPSVKLHEKLGYTFFGQSLKIIIK